MPCTVAFPVNPKRRVKLVSSQQLAYQNLFVGVNLVNALVQKLWRFRAAQGTWPSAGADGPPPLCSHELKRRDSLPLRSFSNRTSPRFGTGSLRVAGVRFREGEAWSSEAQGRGG